MTENRISPNGRDVQPVRPAMNEAHIMALVQGLVEEQCRQIKHELRREMAADKEAMRSELRDELRKELLRQPSAPAAPAPTSWVPHKLLPDIADITKLHVQFWHNPSVPKKKRRKPLYQLSIKTWTCQTHEIDAFPTGTGPELYVPLFRPGSKSFRNLDGNLDYLQVDGAAFIGCVSTPKRHFDQAAIVSPENNLWLYIRGEVLELGQPHFPPANAKPNAAKMHWFFNR